MIGRRYFLPVGVALVAAAVAGLVGCASGRASDPAANTPSGWPVDSRVASVSSNFGARRGGSWHQGIDLSAPEGTPVRATANGKVIVAERSGSWGRTVVIDHRNGLHTRYAHLKRISVDRGDKVTAGEVIGKVGKSGNATGFHLHYEITRDGRPTDPRPFMGGN